MSYTSNVHVLFIMLDLLEDTSTASAIMLIGQVHKVKVICIGVESVHQNCVIGRCAYLQICIWLDLPSFFEI